MILSSLLLALAATCGVVAHGEERSMHPREIASRQLAANRRHVAARNCASEIASYHRRRKMAKRALMGKRAETTGTTSALEPHETTIRNTTCVTAPEVTEGPYYLNNDLVRQDLREDQGGILLELDIGVIDTSTCQPLPNALVELWNCNATGQYSGFSTTTTSSGGTGGGMSMSGAAPSGGTGSSMSTGGNGAAPSGGGGDGTGGVSSGMTDSYNFLRGGWQTNENGIVTFKTIFPGFYTGRTIHMHTMVHQNITYNSNGTYTSRSGSLVHVGQMFFEETLADQIMALSPYSETTMIRTRNAADSILAQENSAGYSAYVDASAISASDISAGVLGFITIGVDTSSSKEVTSNNYYMGGDVYAPVTANSTDGAVTGSTTRTSGATSAANSSSAAQGRSASLRWMTTLLAFLL